MDLLSKLSFAETQNQSSSNITDFCARLNTHIGMVLRTIILVVIMGGSIKRGVQLEHFQAFSRKNYLIKVVSYIHVITKSAGANKLSTKYSVPMS